jgi:tRNA A-37 threonylcarbamoyl transferase component Bud32
MATSVLPGRVAGWIGGEGLRPEDLELPPGVSRGDIKNIDSVGEGRTNETYRVHIDGRNDYILKVFDDPWREKLFYDMGQWMAGLSSQGGYLYDRVRSEIELNEVLEVAGARVASIDLLDIPIDYLEDLGGEEGWAELNREAGDLEGLENGDSVEWYPRELDTSLEVKTTDVAQVSVWMEYLDGEDAKHAIKNSPEDAAWFGEKVGDILGEVHEQDYRLFDVRLENFMLKQKCDGSYGNPGVVDQEFSFQDNSKSTREVDVGNLFASAMQLDYDSFKNFYLGFETNYNREIEQETVGFARIVSMLHSAEEKDFRRAWRSWNNGKKFIEEEYEEGVNQVMISSIETARTRISESDDNYNEEMDSLLNEITENTSRYLKEKYVKKLISAGLRTGELGYEAFGHKNKILCL